MTNNMQSSTKKILLLLAGLGALGAIVLIGLGLLLFWSQRSAAETAVENTPTQTVIVTEVVPTPTVMAGVIVMATATPLPVTVTSQPQLTGTPSKAPTATRQPTNTPTPTPLPLRQAVIAVDGWVELVGPLNDTNIPSNAIEFKWRWHDNKGCEQPPDGYAFEIRVWRDNDFLDPMGAMDAQSQKAEISCDPTSGIRTFVVGNIRSVPGAQGQSSGRLRWDVALVQLNPYKPIITTQYRTFYY